ncbi:MAG: PRC-barrel domain-containing protein [Pseudolabrys sp.]|nr:PRC-barrel domain-containing protein [Pseudolabrys sp.]
MISIHKLTIGAAAAALMASTAVAQTPAPTAPANTPPAATAPAATAPAMTPGGTTAPDIVMSQKPDQWLASKFRGTDVLGADDTKIGDVSDILFDKTGKIDAFVISVGGFLGVGAKSVALSPASFDVVPGKDGGADQLKLSMSKEQLTQAQNFEPYQPPRTTTGANPGGSPRPMNTAPATGR